MHINCIIVSLHYLWQTTAHILSEQTVQSICLYYANHSQYAVSLRMFYVKRLLKVHVIFDNRLLFLIKHYDLTEIQPEPNQRKHVRILVNYKKTLLWNNSFSCLT